jgi:2-dehydro-3-deoxyphosphogluconate aldolase / (4S)-4-hydroxy-2-oxoglutarate aldolase
MNHPQLVAALARARILSAAVIDDPAHAVPLARALLAGGLDVMEVTFRNAHAAECIRRIRAEVPAMLVGAGTLLTPAQVDEARAAGAAFGVTPGFNPTVRHAVATGFTLAPGVLTPGEMEQALELGCPTVKFLPASAAGGPDFIKAVAAPCAHTALRLVPLGGIGEHNLAAYLGLPLVVAVGGSWLTDSKLASAGRWEEITALNRRAVAISSPAPTSPAVA